MIANLPTIGAAGDNNRDPRLSSLTAARPVDGVGESSAVDTAVAEVKAISEPAKLYEPRDDQKLAIKKVVKGFEEHDRGQLILPCGTGKTLTSLWINETMDSDTTLVLVPSIALVKQTKDAWLEQKRKDFDYLCVCSDDKVNAVEADDDIEHTLLAELKEEAKAKVTTDAADIKSFVTGSDSKPGKKVVFATYQSLPKITEALQGTDFSFDLTFADEAHKTTGKKGQLFTAMHFDNKLPSKKRLYMTATPKVHSSDRATAGDYLGMNDESIYGPEFHRMSFAEAIEDGILTDYEIVAVGIKEGDIRAAYEQDGRKLEFDQLTELAHNMAVERVMRNHRCSHGLSFHSSIKKAREFQERQESLYPDVNSYHISGKFNVGKRKEIMDDFKSKPFNQRSIISNARCLTEGVDVPSIDMVYFSDPKNSVVDIVQAAGRAFRQNKAKPDKIGRIVVPVILKDGETVEAAAWSNKFANLISVVSALADHDERLVDQISMSNSDRAAAQAAGEDFRPKIVLEGFDPDLEKAFEDQILASSRELITGSRFASFTDLQAYIIEKHPSVPTNYHECLSEIDVRPIEVQRLAVAAGKLKLGETLRADKARNLIWQLGELEPIIKKLKQLSPTKPDDLGEFFNSEGFTELFGSYAQLLTMIKSLVKDEILIYDNVWSANDIVDIVWGADYDSFETVKQKMLAKFETRPAGALLENMAAANCRIGLNKVVQLAIEAGLIKRTAKKIGAETINELIWGARKSAERLEAFTSYAREQYPQRPDHIYDVLRSLLRAREIKKVPELLTADDRYSDLPRLGGADDYYTVLAEHIWPRNESVEQFTERLKEIESRSHGLSADLVLGQAYVSLYKLLEYYDEFPGLQGSKRGILAPLLLGSDQLRADYRKIEAVITANTFEQNIDLITKPEEFEKVTGVNLLDFLRLVKPAARLENTYVCAQVASNCLNLGKGYVDQSKVAKDVIMQEQPNVPKELSRLQELVAKFPNEFDYLCPGIVAQMDDLFFNGYSDLFSRLWGRGDLTLGRDGQRFVNEHELQQEYDAAVVVVNPWFKGKTEADIRAVVGPFRSEHPNRPDDIKAYRMQHKLTGKWAKLKLEARNARLIDPSETNMQVSDAQLMDVIWPQG